MLEREVALTYPAEGVVEAVRQATIAAQVSGRIRELRVDAGMPVKAGEVLLHIDAREAQEGLRGTQALFANAQARMERARRLFAQKFISQAALEQAEAEYKAAAATRGQASVLQSFATLTAPFAGVIAQRLTEQGEMAVPGKALLTIFAPQDLRVLASIPQDKMAEIRALQKGRATQAALSAQIELSATRQWLEGGKLELLPSLESGTHAQRVRISLPAAAVTAHGLVPGLFVRAHFTLGTAKKLLLPAAAVFRRGELTGVYVLPVAQAGKARAKPQLRQVRVGEALPGGALEVLAGLSAGEEVALEPIKAGMWGRHE